MMDSTPKQKAPWSSNYEKKLLFSFGAVVFVLIAVAFATSNWFFLRAEKKNLDQLATTVTQVISHSVNMVSFSGKYHTRNLLVELVEKDARLSYVAVQDLQGKYFAHSNPGQNGKSVSTSDIALAHFVIDFQTKDILHRTVDGLSVLEVIIPFRSGYEQQISGVVQVGISLEEMNVELRLIRLYLILLSIALAGISVLILIKISHHYGGPVQHHMAPLQGIMDHAPMAIFLHTEDETIVSANLEFRKEFCGETTLKPNSKVSDFVIPRIGNQCTEMDKDVFSLKRRISSEVDLVVGDETRTVLVSKFPVGEDKASLNSVVCTFLFDITATRDLENQLRQSQKMEAIGHLAGGVAHDFNNLLTGIIGFADLSKMAATGNTEVEEYLNQLLSAAGQASHLTQSLLAFSRKQVIDLSPVDLNLVVGRMESLLKRVIGEDIELVCVMDPAPLGVLADASQIEQVILNLATNSRDAMPQGGSLSISTTRIEITEKDQSRARLNAGRYAAMTVTDTGCGIPLEFLDNIFEPFFTTKDVGKGTGLGLSMAYGIIKQHGGNIQVQSTPGRGTKIEIFLPMVDDTEIISQDESASCEIRGGHEKILLVEDEKIVRGLLTRILSSAGYEVLTAEDGLAGMELFKEEKDSIDLVMLDMIMPRMNGHEAYTGMRRICPDMKAIFMSGYTADHIRKHTNIDGDLNIIHKPFRREDLLIRIRKTLNGE